MASRLIFMILFLFYSSPVFAGSYSGLWWDSTKAGQGLSIIQESQKIYGAWYLYDEKGRDMWLSFSGNIQGNTMEAQLLRYTGPPLGQQWDESMLQSSVAGSITLTFQNEEHALMHYQVDGANGDMNLTPFANDSAKLYWDSSMQGQGVGIFQEGGSTYAVWYLYDKNGKSMWLTVPELFLDGTKESNFLRYTGPSLGGQWNPEMVSSRLIGTGKFTSTGDSAIAMNYQFPSLNGSLYLTPFTMSDPSDGDNDPQPVNEHNTLSSNSGSETILLTVNAYVTFQRDGGQGNCGEDPWFSSDCTNLKDWWGINCYLAVLIPAIAIKDGEDRWVITDQEDVLSRYGYANHPFLEDSYAYYYDLEFTYVTSPCQANIEGIDFNPNILGTVENGVIDLTYLAEPQIRAWGSCGQASFDWTDQGIKYGWGMGVSGDPLDLSGKIYLEDKTEPGTYIHTYSVDTNPSPQNRDHVTVKLEVMCLTPESDNGNGFTDTPCPWD